MHFPPDLFAKLQHWGPIVLDLAQSLASIAAFAGIITIAIAYARNRRDAARFRREQWRISYRNLNITHEALLTKTAGVPALAASAPVAVGAAAAYANTLPRLPSPASLASLASLASPTADFGRADESSQFLIFRLIVENIGDGPVDVWACLIAGRELNAGDHHESWGGNIEWNDLDPYYFNTYEPPEYGELAGISNTRHSVYSQDDYIELDPKERDTLTRIDRIDPVRSHRTLLYRAFLVGRGYGGDRGRVSKRDFLAWQRIQQALFNLSGPSFRIVFGEKDPLDRVADRDGWQCFMLYHLAFTNDSRDRRGWTYIDRLNAQLEVKQEPPLSDSEAMQLCMRELAPDLARWRRNWEAFNQAVERCKALAGGLAELLDSGWKPNIPGEPVDDLDRSHLSAREAFKRLPAYLRWDPEEDDTLPVWEKFFVVTLTPEGVLMMPSAAGGIVRGATAPLVR